MAATAVTLLRLPLARLSYHLRSVEEESAAKAEAPSGSTIVGIGSPDPPAFVYDDEDYNDVFVSEACLLTRDENEWYREPISTNATSGKEGLQASVAD
ncbi:4-diphosphocytidyl-2-C-methyl-D-erythritol kinase chloroplastic [Zea mays]|uniref:4-diphosphocytidyl-2-C-methyl-D-erythritol kinase chloroplastic n=1 Tax=Zea mays TaxID=4577 RepID=A0A1D6KIE2_MAIZE|nr:4-diphosphocytidyl-2-C-methyl-D-erythritol kinase chloroplastic [Zea mays]